MIRSLPGAAISTSWWRKWASPNVHLYRPRKITANAVTDDDEILCGVVVFGTHDIALAHPLADQYVGVDGQRLRGR